MNIHEISQSIITEATLAHTRLTNPTYFVNRVRELVRDVELEPPFHVEDLTKNVYPFCMLDDDTKERFRYHIGELEVLADDGEFRLDTGSIQGFCPDLVYRARPQKPLTVPWELLDEKIKFAAADKSGSIWGYTEKPAAGNIGFFPVNSGVGYRIDCIKGVERGNVPWRKSLISRM